MCGKELTLDEKGLLFFFCNSEHAYLAVVRLTKVTELLFIARSTFL